MARRKTNGINLRADGRWCKTFKGRKIYLGRGTRREAEHAFELIKARHALDQPEPDDGTLTVKQLTRLFLASKEREVKQGRYSPQTLLSMKYDMAWLNKTLGKKQVSNLRGYDFSRLMDHFGETSRATAINIKVQHVRQLFRWAAEQDLIPVVPRMGDFKRISAAQERRERNEGPSRVFTHEEIHRLLDAASGPWKAMILVGINAAYDGSSIGRLKQDDVPVGQAFIQGVRAKSGIPMACYLWDETMDEIEKVRSESEFLFINRQGRPFDVIARPQAISNTFGTLCKKIGITRRIGFHSFRHTFASIASLTSYSDRVIRSVTGHHNQRDTLNNHYIKGVDRLGVRGVCLSVRAWLFDHQDFANWRDIRCVTGDWVDDEGRLIDGASETLKDIESRHPYLK